MIFSKKSWQLILAWLYCIVLVTAWWFNNYWLVGFAGVVLAMWSWFVASRSTVLIVTCCSVLVILAFWIPLPIPTSLPILIRLAIMVFVWTQLALLVITVANLRTTNLQKVSEGVYKRV